MTGIAEQGDPPESPSVGNGPVEQRPLVDVDGGVEDPLQHRVPGAERKTNLVDVGRDPPALVRPVRLDDRHHVVELAAAHPVGDDVTVRPEAQRDGRGRCVGAEGVARDEHAVRHVAGEPCLVAAEEGAADRRVHTIGSDQHVSVKLATVGEPREYATGVLSDLDDVGVEVDARGSAARDRAGQDLVEVAAMDVEVRVPVALSCCRLQRDPNEGGAAAAVLDLQGSRLERMRCERLEQVELGEHGACVGRDLDPRTEGL